MPFFQERYLLIIAPAFSILVARGLGWMGDRSPWALVLGLLCVVSASSISLHNWFFDDAYTKGEYRLTMDCVRDHVQQGDLLLLVIPSRKRFSTITVRLVCPLVFFAAMIFASNIGPVRLWPP